jgi:hypothetical protein
MNNKFDVNRMDQFNGSIDVNEPLSKDGKSPWSYQGNIEATCSPGSDNNRRA